MKSLTRCTLTTTAALTTLAGAGLGLVPSAQASPSPFAASTSARVPTGWTAVETGTYSSRPANNNLVYAVATSGEQRLVLRLPNSEQVDAVSPDGRRIATTVSGNGRMGFKVYDLATHRVTNLPLHGSAIHFTNPTGTAVYVLPGTTGTMVRADLQGRVLARFPGITHQGVSFLSAVPMPDGTMVWGENLGHVTLSNNATGTQLRVLPTPRGYGDCTVTRVWNATTAVGSCYSGPGWGQVFLFHTNGTTTPLTGPLTGKLSSAKGYTDAWNSSTGLVAQQEILCGSAPATLQVGHGGRDIPIDQVTDVMGRTALGLTHMSCDSNNGAFVRADLPSMRQHTLLVPAAGRHIMAAITNDATAGTGGH